MTYYPFYRIGLRNNIMAAFAFSSVGYEITESDFEDVFAGLRDYDKFCRAASFAALLIRQFSAEQLKQAVGLISANLVVMILLLLGVKAHWTL